MQRRDCGPTGIAAFVDAWSRALRGVGFVPLTPGERRAVLTELAERLATAATADRFDPHAARRVGADLVTFGFSAPEVLGHTVTLLYARCAADLAGRPDRLAELVAAVTSGFVRGVRDRALEAQEEVRVAALTAKTRAEEALRSSEARFRHLATHDSLTGLPNRRLLTEHLARRVQTAGAVERLGLCCLGFDGFASLYHALGHRVGERLVVAAAERLRSLARPAGHLVARVDSDQFAILIERTTSQEDAIKVADQALSALSAPFQIDGHELSLTASAGLVERPTVDADPTELLRAGQIALHWAKEDGRGRWRLFHPARSAQDAERYRLSAAMPAALRRSEFDLAYQPLIWLRDGRLAGFEALARWRHPEYGLLTADRFIGLAADTGLIVPLGNHLLEQACRRAATWRSPGEPPIISVNLAVRQLRDSGLLGNVSEILDRSGLPPHRLQLEITEHSMISTSQQIIGTLTGLARLGVRIVVDDFGTGYSNLAYLGTLPLHGLKLDAAFLRRPVVAGVDHDAVLAAIVRLGHTAGLQVTGEGIETAAHAHRLRAAGADIGQGYFLGRPVPAGMAARLAERGRLAGPAVQALEWSRVGQGWYATPP